MKRRMITFLMMVTMMVALSACSKEEVPVPQPDVLQIRSICELATMECHYHNVAKSIKTKGTGISGIGEKDREFWTEYTGVVKIGIDMSEVTMTVKDTLVEIKIPPAKLLDDWVNSGSYNADSVVFSEDGFFNKNKITSADQLDAINNAQEEMKNQVVNDKSLLQAAEERAKKLIENYIKGLGDTVGVQYTIKWVE